MAEENRTPDHRPSPEALLEVLKREERQRGRLKIFLGAAPGVGKTYEMLRTARAKVKEGADVVVGVVETHGRKETKALLRGLEIIPPRQIEYKGQTLDELDIDAVIARRPEIALIDELAHTNAPTSRHPKRYLDVEELLDEGIDVFTTINIQHIDSLNDVVAQITGIRVRETVPDSILARADDVELVDITPEDLIQRLKEGKVYVPDQARRALENFFSPVKLTALRELALRRTADRVDEQLVTQLRAKAMSGPWAACERVLVCVNEDLRSPALVRYAKRAADRLHAQWTAVTIETRRSLRFSEGERNRIAEAMRLAELLGGETLTMPGSSRSIADDIISYARAHNVTQIIIGKSDRPRWFEILNGSVVHDLVRQSGNISVHVISGEQLPTEPAPAQAVRTAEDESRHKPLNYLITAIAMTGALGVAWVLRPWIGVESVDLIFLTAIVGVAAKLGIGPSLVASVAGALLYNYFFLPPLFTFTIDDAKNVAAFLCFVVVAVTVSNIAARMRSQAVIAVNRASTTESLYGFSRKLAGTGTLDDVLWATVFQIASMLKVRVVLLLPENGSIAVKAGYPPEDELDQSDLAAATWAWTNDRPAGRGSDTLPGSHRLFIPLRTARGIVGVVGIDSDRPGPLLSPDQRRLFDALVNQGALAIERVHLVEDVERAKRSIETERLRAALLTSLSHDLKTPLAAILGAATTMRDLGDKFDAEARSELLATIIDESERLNRFIANLLDMTKLEAGAIVAKTEMQDVGEIIDAALKRARKLLSKHRVHANLPPEPLKVDADPVLLEQVFFNLLDNAAKYAPEDTLIEVSAWNDRGRIVIQIRDEGPGIPERDVEKIFDKFYRANKADHVRAGTGLGLPISRGFIEIMGGTITADNRADRSGALLTVTLPASVRSETLENAA